MFFFRCIVHCACTEIIKLMVFVQATCCGVSAPIFPRWENVHSAPPPLAHDDQSDAHDDSESNDRSKYAAHYGGVRV
jgi:hypothetical protein